MSVWFVVMSILAAVNPPRVAIALSATDRNRRVGPLNVGMVVGGVVVVALAIAGNWVLDVLEVTDETWRIATGAIAVLAGAHHLAIRAAKPVPAMRRPVHGVVPVAFPVVLVPELVVMAVLYGATESAGVWLAALAVGFGAGAAWGRAGDGPVTVGAARLLAAVLIVGGIAMLVLGIRDV